MTDFFGPRHDKKQPIAGFDVPVMIPKSESQTTRNNVLPIHEQNVDDNWSMDDYILFETLLIQDKRHRCCIDDNKDCLHEVRVNTPEENCIDEGDKIYSGDTKEEPLYDWQRIASMMPGKTSWQVENQYYRIVLEQQGQRKKPKIKDLCKTETHFQHQQTAKLTTECDNSNANVIGDCIFREGGETV